MYRMNSYGNADKWNHVGYRDVLENKDVCSDIDPFTDWSKNVRLAPYTEYSSWHEKQPLLKKIVFPHWCCFKCTGRVKKYSYVFKIMSDFPKCCWLCCDVNSLRQLSGSGQHFGILFFSLKNYLLNSLIFPSHNATTLCNQTCGCIYDSPCR